MTATTQKRLAIAGAIAALAIFAGANVHLITVSFNSHPECAPISTGRAPAQDMC
ncbi:MAG: hypothetical protein H3C51_10990 [Rubellimicrobium sp.]|nr:hypothetical protein [Rubellimicrobium sp.]